MQEADYESEVARKFLALMNSIDPLCQPLSDSQRIALRALEFQEATDPSMYSKRDIADMTHRRQQGQTWYTIASAHHLSTTTVAKLVGDELKRQGIDNPKYSRPKRPAHGPSHPIFD